MFLSFALSLLSLPLSLYAQSTPLPPLQWINLSPLLQGSYAPPPLKDAAIGYDYYSRSLIIFGGESQAGFPQSQTYLLNLDTLAWSPPKPPPTLTQVPPARSAAMAGVDFAASYRHGFVVIGGKGDQGQALSDVWEYDFNNQFWSKVSVSPGGPSARWGAAGGIDTRVVTLQDPLLPNPNNTFYLAGGTSGSHSSSLSDVWRFNISGTLTANVPGSVGSWDHLNIGNLPAKAGEGGTAIYNQIVIVGGCNDTTAGNSSCAQRDSYVITVGSSNDLISPNPCPAPRYGPKLVPNMNEYSSSFSSQVFVLSGLYNSSLWDVGAGTNDGEISVLDINTGTWTRALPSKDPSTSSRTSYPVAREGAAAIANANGLVGQNRDRSADIIMFGGRGASGQYLSDLWLLRSYNGSVTSSSPSWSGFGDGQLQTGVDADGSGVQIHFPSQCATRITASGTNRTNPSSPQHSDSTTGAIYNTSVIHKILAPLSVALLFPTVVYFRLTLSTYTHNKVSESHLRWFLAAATLTFLAYAMAIVGLVLSFTFISSSPTSAHTTLPTAHSQAGLAFFACLYVLTPALFILCSFLARSTFQESQSDRSERRNNSLDMTEKPGSLPGHGESAAHSVRTSPPSSPHTRSHSIGASAMWGRTNDGAVSSDTESVTSGGAHRGFEVLNRPPRNRPQPSGWAQAYVESSQPLNPRGLSDVDWLLRRRSLGAVDELDYAITQIHNARNETSATTEGLISPKASNGNPAVFPPVIDAVTHIFLQASLLGISIISLIVLWSKGYKVGFALFLIWTVLFYLAIFLLSWFGRPEKSVLSTLIYRLRGGEIASITPDKQLDSQNRPPSPHTGPYLHHPPHRVATREELAHVRPQSATSDDDDDIDEGTRQRMIEEEMERRDVSIVTVPRRRLWVANPS